MKRDNKSSLAAKPLHRMFVAVLAILLGLGGIAATLHAQAEEQGAIGVKVPRLAQHTFAPSTFVRDPFIKTYVRNSLGIGRALELDIPLLVIERDTVFALRGDLFFASLQFEYQQAVKDWLAVWVQVSALARLGNGVESLLSQGVTTATGFELGWMFKLWQTDEIMLSGTLNLWNNSFTGINLLDFVRRIIEEGRIAPDNQLVRKTPSVRGGGGLRFAWGASDLLGFNFTAESGYGESVERTAGSEWFVNFGGTIDIDLRAKTPVPLGIILGYRQNTYPDGGDPLRGNIRAAYWRISYNDEDDFSIGLETSFTRIPLKLFDQTIKLGGTVISMRHYF